MFITSPLCLTYHYCTTWLKYHRSMEICNLWNNLWNSQSRHVWFMWDCTVKNKNPMEMKIDHFPALRVKQLLFSLSLTRLRPFIVLLLRMTDWPFNSTPLWARVDGTVLRLQYIPADRSHTSVSLLFSHAGLVLPWPCSTVVSPANVWLHTNAICMSETLVFPALHYLQRFLKLHCWSNF